jgi:four helix bundle protein
MAVSRFEELVCWQEAAKLAVDVYSLSNMQKFSRDFGFRDQLRRSAVSIPSNIAEGKERETVSELIRYLYIAKGSAGELKTQLYLAREIGYIAPEQYVEMRRRVERIGTLIGALIRALKKQEVLRASRFSRVSR